jgi:heterotetrameric sarcosine oxidase gamma subunit
LQLLNRVSCNEIDVAPGRVVYTQWLNEKGGVEADLTVFRLAAAEFLVVTSVASQLRDRRHLERHVDPGERVTIVDVSSEFAMLGLMGPRSRDVLTALSASDLSAEAFPFGTTREIEIATERVRATRITYVGELGWEILVPAQRATTVFDAIIAAGAPHGISLAGYHAMASLRIEKAYRHWGHDVTPDETPFEAGLAFCIAWDKRGGFIGRDALLARRATAPRTRLVQFLLRDATSLLYHDEPIWRDGKRVGRITSGMYGHTLGGAVGLGYVDLGAPNPAEAFEAGRYELEVAGTMVPATASLRPLYDPASKRARS